MEKFQENISNPPNEKKKEDINLKEENEKHEKLNLENTEEIRVKKKTIKRNPFIKTIDDSISIINSFNFEEINIFI